MIIEQLRNILILAIFLIVVVAANTVYKSNNSICPSDFKDPKKETAFVREWLENFIKNNPNASIADVSRARVDFWIDNNCKKSLRRYADGMAEEHVAEVLKELQSKRTLICSDEYENREDYLEAVVQWLSDFYDKHPADITIDEMLFARKNFLIEGSCKETLQ